MTKALEIMLALSMLLFFSSCIEDSGTSFETEESNENEVVNPNHIRPYSNLDSLSRMIQMTTTTVPTNGQLATEMVKIYYMPGHDISGIVQQYNLGDMAQSGRMVGQPIDEGGTTTTPGQTGQDNMTTVQDSLNEVTGDQN